MSSTPLQPVPAIDPRSTNETPRLDGMSPLPATLVRELWAAAEADRFGWAESDFGHLLWRCAQRYNAGISADSQAAASFLRGLQLRDFALAQACALGDEVAWRIFLEQYGERVRQAAIAIARSTTQGEELASSLYAQLYGLAEREGVRLSPLASYAGRGSLMGWLRTTLAQRHVDGHRRTRRETSLEDEQDFEAVPTEPQPAPAAVARLSNAVALVLRAQPPEDAFLLAAYFLDGRTLQQLAGILRVHEATVSRRLKHLTSTMHRQLLKQLEAEGMSRRAAQESLGTDPRDLDLNLRLLLQTSPGEPFSVQTGKTGRGLL